MKRMFYSAAVVLIVVSGVAAAPALTGAALPAYEGGTFSSIKGPADPEEFSWEVTLYGDQELQQVDDQHAKVVYADTGVTAFGISAELAHDAEGTEVPTSLTVSGGNVLTLTVHHRAGNPAADGAPFTYPIIAGAGWEGGFATVRVVIPPEELPLATSASTPPPAGCVVPALVGRSLKANRKRLRKAGCKLGRVSGKRSKAAKVVKQNPRPGELLAPGARVAVTVAQSSSANA